MRTYFDRSTRLRRIRRTAKCVEQGKVVFDGLLKGVGDLMISISKAVASKARVGWSIPMELSQVRNKRRILSVGNVYP